MAETTQIEPKMLPTTPEIFHYIDELKRLQGSHISVTVNTVDPSIGARIYFWMRVGKRVVVAKDGAAV